METPVFDLTIPQGATFKISFDYADEAGLPVDLTGYQALMQVRDKVGGRVFASLTDSNGAITLNVEPGRIDVEISKTLTRGMTFETGVYDLFIFTRSGTSAKVVRGAVISEKSVSLP